MSGLRALTYTFTISAAREDLYNRSYRCADPEALTDIQTAVTNNHCASTCLGTDQCFGFTFYRPTNKCELISQTHLDEQMSFVKMVSEETLGP